jgi:hypothetical protein
LAINISDSFQLFHLVVDLFLPVEFISPVGVLDSKAGIVFLPRTSGRIMDIAHGTEIFDQAQVAAVIDMKGFIAF